MTTKTTVKKQHTISGLAFDPDLRGLFKLEQSVEILGKKVRFLAPSIIQKALMVRFLVLALQDMVSTESDRATMKLDDLYVKCVSKLGELQGEPKTPQELEVRQYTLGRMFASPDANKYLVEAIAQSFPDLDEPEKLTDEAFVGAATVLIQSMQL